MKCYFPADTWVDYYTGTVTKSAGQQVTVHAPYDKIPIYVRAGSIIVQQAPNVTTTQRYICIIYICIEIDNCSHTEILQHLVPAPYHYTGTKLVRYWYDTETTLVRHWYQCSTSVVLMQYQCCTGAVEVPRRVQYQCWSCTGVILA